MSPQAGPGLRAPISWFADSDEHTPDGHITEDLDVRIQMQNKRPAQGGRSLVENLIPPDYLGPDAGIHPACLLGFHQGGRLWRAARLRTEQGRTHRGCLHFSQVFPLAFGTIFLPLLRQAREDRMRGGQTAPVNSPALIRQTTGFEFDTRISAITDGLPFTARYILDHLQDRPTGGVESWQP